MNYSRNSLGTDSNTPVKRLDKDTVKNIIYRTLCTQDGLTVYDLHKILDLKLSTARNYVKELVTSGWVISNETKENGRVKKKLSSVKLINSGFTRFTQKGLENQPALYKFATASLAQGYEIKIVLENGSTMIIDPKVKRELRPEDLNLE